MLHEAKQGGVNAALRKIARLPVVKAEPVMFRVENFS
jgi:hypothetical protein